MSNDETYEPLGGDNATLALRRMHAENFGWGQVELDAEELSPFLEAERIHERKAIELLRSRLPKVEGFSQSKAKKGKMAAFILSQLPEEAWTEEFLSRVNLVPMLESFADIDGKGDEINIGTWRVGEKYPYDPEVVLTGDDRTMAARYAHVIKQDQLGKLGVKFQNEFGRPPDEDELKALRDEINQSAVGTYRAAYEEPLVDPVDVDTEIRVEADPSAVTDAATPGNAFDIDLEALLATGGQEEFQRPSFMTGADFNLLFNTQTADQAIGTYLNELSRRKAFDDERANAMRNEGFSYEQVGPGAPVDDLRIQYRDEVDPVRQRALGPGGNSVGGAVAGKPAQMDPKWDRQQATLTQTLNLPFTMSRTELKQLQDRMTEAGYFDGENAKPAEIGNPADPAFKRAWRELISQSVQTDTPMWELLGRAIESRETLKAEARDSFTARISDPSSIRLTAKTLAQRMLGRNVTDEEAADLVAQVHAWETDHQRRLYERSATDDEGNPLFDDDGSAIVDVDWEARMTEYIRDQNPDEAAAKDQANAYEDFRSMIGGPGRTPGRRGVLR